MHSEITFHFLCVGLFSFAGPYLFSTDTTYITLPAGIGSNSFPWTLLLFKTKKTKKVIRNNREKAKCLFTPFTHLYQRFSVDSTENQFELALLLMANNWRWCCTPKRVEVQLLYLVTGFVTINKIVTLSYQHLPVLFEELCPCSRVIISHWLCVESKNTDQIRNNNAVSGRRERKRESTDKQTEKEANHSQKLGGRWKGRRCTIKDNKLKFLKKLLAFLLCQWILQKLQRLLACSYNFKAADQRLVWRTPAQLKNGRKNKRPKWAQPHWRRLSLGFQVFSGKALSVQSRPSTNPFPDKDLRTKVETSIMIY